MIPVTKYTVSYAAGDGTGTMTGDLVIAGNTYTVRGNEFTAPAGKTFKCWKIGDKEYVPGQKVAVAGDVTFTAVWQTKTDSGLDYVPKTGDTFSPMLWAFLLTFSAAALTGTVAIRRKRK